jgi:type IX secretion system PorP/SprF family membrane protein
MNKLIKTLLLLVLTPAIIQAQDIHFSQFYNSPLTLNPTLTGYMNGNFRLGAIYRNQWREVTKPFVTTSGSFDLPIRKGFGDNDVMGVGAVFFHDQSGTVNLATVSVNVSFAYHKVLGINLMFFQLVFRVDICRKKWTCPMRFLPTRWMVH